MLLVVALLGLALGNEEGACVDYATDPGQLVDLEPQATKGALDEGALECLEEAYTQAAEQTTKDKISRVLLVNAYALDTRVWLKLVQRHLDEVDRSDPDIAFLYAYHLHNNGTASAEEVIRWTEVGLERKQDWTGDIFVMRVYSLMKLRATAAASVWRSAEQQYAESGEPALKSEVETQRNRTKTFAREWLDFAKVAQQDTEEALGLCVSAGSKKACLVDASDSEDG